ncbi:plasmid mobilization protein [Moritella viscosa]|uniref:Uncharacterized protein n=1 Tax=Moritella viscosa TaxID=80854 RepID=A0A1L0AIC1_9GAMM|nr:plasmid mobilization relaxosome protein MobC [Moritella viscosa]SGZ16667.1 Putative uncharacterized protein [Moritella viscosa]SGZ18326.1 Putative uncharacterized protein [Moritella viscosa]SHO28167.1 Putative uncharacterized protein [Moritella viscosa]
MDEKTGLDVKRERIIKIRVTENEYLELKQKSTKPRLAEWMRESCLGIASSKRKQKVPSVDPALLRQLSAMGNNLNQIARQINVTKSNVINHIYILSVLSAIQSEIKDIKNDSESTR